MEMIEPLDLKELRAALLKSEGQKCGKTVFSFRVMLNSIFGTLVKHIKNRNKI
jgi:hypothetical protein